MIQDTTKSPYPGVLCSRCKERIPVAARAALIYEKLKHGEVSLGQGLESRAFVLRCKVCNEEGVYGVEEIHDFEGPPRARASKAK